MMDGGQSPKQIRFFPRVRNDTAVGIVESTRGRSRGDQRRGRRRRRRTMRISTARSISGAFFFGGQHHGNRTTLGSRRAMVVIVGEWGGDDPSHFLAPGRRMGDGSHRQGKGGATNRNF